MNNPEKRRRKREQKKVVQALWEDQLLDRSGLNEPDFEEFEELEGKYEQEDALGGQE